MKNLLSSHTSTRTNHVLYILGDTSSTEHSGNLKFNSTTDAIDLTCSDGFTATGVTGTAFTHTWDTTKDIQYTETKKIRWIIVDTNTTNVSYLWPIIGTAAGSASYRRIIGMIFDKIIISSNTEIRDMYGLEYCIFMNGAYINNTMPFNGYFAYCADLQYVENLNMQYSTDTANLQLSGDPLLVNVQNINRSLKVLPNSNSLFNTNTVNALISGLSTTGTGLTLTIGSINLGVANSTLVTTAQTNGWTLS